jgi:hypothetical protein
MAAMSAPAASLLPIFATPFAAVPLAVTAESNRALAQRLTALATAERRDPDAPSDPLLFRSREELFEWPDAAIANLRAEMLGGLCAAVQAANLCTEAEFAALAIQARARLLIVHPNGCVPVSSAALASWRAVYCVAAPAPPAGRLDSGTLRLYETRFGSMFSDASNVRLRPSFAAGHYAWRPGPGLMAVFPAPIPYEIALNRAAGDLILVSARVRFAHASQETLPAW